MGNRVISQIKIGNEIFDIRDKIGPDGALHFIGINDWSQGGPSHKIHNGGSETPYINGIEIPLSSLKTGDVVLQNKTESTSTPSFVREEYLWIRTNETTYAGNWELLGDEGSYVIKGNYSTQVTASEGSVLGAHTFTGTTATITINGTITGGNFTVTTTDDTSVPEITWSDSHAHTINIGSGNTESGHNLHINSKTLTLTFTPNVTINVDTTKQSEHQFNGTPGTITVTGSGMTGVQSHDYTPGGTITIGATTTTSGHSFQGTTHTITLSLNANNVTSTCSYQPKGSISKPTLTLTPTDGSVISSVAMTTTGGVLLGTVAANSEILELFNLSSGTTTVLTGMTGTIAAPNFSGSTATITVTSLNRYVSSINPYEYTPDGDIQGDHMFTGTATTLEHTSTTGNITLTGTYTPDGTITGTHSVNGQTTTVTFTHTHNGDVAGNHTLTSATVSFSKRLIAAIQNLALTAEGDYQPAGTVTASGSEASGHTLSMVAHSHTISFT